MVETENTLDPIHRIRTSEVLDIKYVDNGFIVYTKNTEYWFEEV